ncbi:MAG: response regulator transcription factor [Campylobacterota bacterium]|nr:response regulator transcription factor [Campylobacterota bacterium]
MKLKILLLEDDMELNDTITSFLVHEGFEVIQSYDADDAKNKAFEQSFELWLFDVKVPFQSGIDLLNELRQEGYDTPAIFITSLSSVEDVSRGFESGGDDYIRKPFALKELKLRIEAVIKRRYSTTQEHIRIDDIHTFDPLEKLLYINNKRIALKPKEATFLALFLQHKNHIVTKEMIFDTLYSYGEEPNEGSLRTFVKVLRHHLGKTQIETIKEVGYRFVSR